MGDRVASSFHLSRRRFLAAAGLMGVSVAMGGVAPARLARSRSPSSNLAHAGTLVRLPIDPAPPRPWAGNPDATLANYRAVLAALAQDIAPRDVPLLPAFIRGDVTELQPRDAYREVIRTVFSPDLLLEHLAAELPGTIVDAQQDAAARASSLAWRGAESAEAAMVAFRRTGDTRFLDLFVDYFDQVLRLRDNKLGIRDDRLGRHVPAWGDGHLIRGRWIAHVTTTARICYAPTEFARVVLDRPYLARYQNRARAYIVATEQALATFDGDYRRVPGDDMHYYRRPGTQYWEPMNHAHQVGRVLLNLHMLTGEARYRRRAVGLATVFLRSVNYVRSGYPYWRYWPYFESGPPSASGRAEPIWKASCTMPFVHHAALQQLLDPSLPDAAARSFATRLVRDGELNLTIDPVRFAPLGPHQAHANRAAWIGGWLEFLSREPRIYDRVVELLVAHRTDYLPHGWFGRPSIARGYAYRLGAGSV